MGTYMLMPKLDMSMEEGIIVRWIKQTGETTTRGDIVVEIETGKVSLEVDNPTAEGTILAQYFEAGDEVEVNTPIMYVGTPDEIPPTKEEVMGTTGQEKAAQTEETTTSTSPTPEDTTPKVPGESSQVSYDYDIAIIGGGPGGYVSAIRAAQLGAKVVLVEREHLGGVCLNKGCIPTKSFLKNGEVLRQIQEASTMGITIANYTVDWKKVLTRKNSVVKTLTNGVKNLLQKNKVTVISGEATLVNEHTISVAGLMETGNTETTMTATNIVLASGTVPTEIPITSDGTATIHSSAKLLDISKIPEDLLIIGGGIIGVEMATIFNRFGTKVTIVEMMDTILAPVDIDIQKLITKELQKDGITLYTGTKLESIAKKKALLSNGKTIDCTNVLVSIGRTPTTNCIGTLPIATTDKGFIQVDEYMQTSVPNVYAIGDVTGKSMLAHTASKQGIVVAENLYGEDTIKMNYQAVPSCIFTTPEIAYVGITEQEAKQQNIPYKTSTFPFSAIGKALAMNETTGFVKMIIDPTYGEILGVHIIGPHASDLIAEGTLAMTAEATYETIGETIHPHPTLSESLMEACEAIDNRAIHM